MSTLTSLALRTVKEKFQTLDNIHLGCDGKHRRPHCCQKNFCPESPAFTALKPYGVSCSDQQGQTDPLITPTADENESKMRPISTQAWLISFYRRPPLRYMQRARCGCSQINKRRGDANTVKEEVDGKLVCLKLSRYGPASVGVVRSWMYMCVCVP